MLQGGFLQYQFGSPRLQAVCEAQPMPHSCCRMGSFGSRNSDMTTAGAENVALLAARAVHAFARRARVDSFQEASGCV